MYQRLKRKCQDLEFRIIRRYLEFKLDAIRSRYFSKDGPAQSKQRVLVYDPFLEGHHVFYNVVLANNLIMADKEVVILTPDPRAIKEKFQKLGCAVENVSFIKSGPAELGNIFGGAFWLSADGEAAAALKFWTMALEGGVRAFPDQEFHLFLPFLDVFIPTSLPSNFFDDFENFSFSGVYFHPKWTRIPTLVAPPILKSSKVSTVLTLDRNICSLMQKGCSAKVQWLPDFADLSLPSGESFKLKFEGLNEFLDGRPVVSLLGSLEKRKGIMGFLKLATDSEMSGFQFICLGKLSRVEFSSEELKIIDSLEANSTENLYLRTKNFIEDESDLNGLIALSDVKFLGYDSFLHSSNFLTKCAHFNVPVVVQETGYMSEVVKEFDLGEVSASPDVADFKASIHNVMLRRGNVDGQERYAKLNAIAELGNWHLH